MEALGLAFISAVTEAVFSHLLPKAEPKLRQWLGRDPAKLAFQTALAQRYTRFDRSHHEWTAALFDDAFLCRPDVSWELSRLLTDGETPDVGVMAGAWAEYFGAGRRERRVEEITPVIADFLAGLKSDLRQQEALRPAYDSKTLDNIAASTESIASDTAELRRLLEQALAVARLSHTHTTILHAYPALQDYSYDFGDAIARVARWFVGRKPLFASLDAFIRQHPCGYFRIEAGAGLGKTAIAAELARRYDALVHFFSASEGITSPDRCLNHLCAQLIARFDLPHTHLPARAGADAAFFRSLLAEAAARQDGRPLILVVDALDEAEPVSPGHNPAHLPGSLPQGVYIALTHRPGDYPLQTEAATRVQLHAIAWDDENQQDDIEQHLRRQAQRPEIRRALEGASPPLTADRFVAALKQRSEGNFKYLDYVLADIEGRKPGFDPLNLAGLPQGLEGYYEHFWQRMETAGKAEGWAEWRGLYKPALSYLAAAGEPVTALWLAVQTKRPADEVLERVLSPWRRFLRRQWQDGRETWAIVHQSFADFVATKLDLTAAHRTIARSYLDFPTLWPDHNGYAFRHLSAHLAQAGMFTELGDLIENRAWYEAQRDHDPSLTSFAEDVNRALALAEQRGLDGLPQVVAWSLLVATVRTRATQVPIEALETMVLLGEGERALRYAALITDAERQSEAYLRLAEQFRSSNDLKRARQALYASQAVSASIRDERKRANAHASVAVALAEAGEFDRALVAAANIGDEWWRALVLAGVAQALVHAGEFERALAAVASIGDERSREEATMDVAQALAQEDEFDRALTAAASMRHERTSARAVAGVAQALARAGEFDRALATAASIGDERRRADALADVAQTLAQVGDLAKASEVWQQALAAAASIDDDGRHAEVLEGVARALAQAGELTQAREVSQRVPVGVAQAGEFDRTLAAVENDGYERNLAEVLAGVAQAGEYDWPLAAVENDGYERNRAGALADVTQAGEFDWTLAVVENAGHVWNRAQAMASAAQVLAQAGEFEQALAAACIGNEESRARALAEVAQALAQAGELVKASEAWQRAQAAATSIDDEGRRLGALTGVARALAQTGEFDRALAVAASIADERGRAKVLTGVSQALAQVGEYEQALAVVESIGDEEDSRAMALTEVAQALAQVGERADVSELWQQALAAAANIGDDRWRGKALADVAQALTQITVVGDERVSAWVREAFAKARTRGRDEVSNHIAAFAPVLTKLGVISATWDRLQAVEAVLSGQPLLAAPSPSSPTPA